MELVFFMMKWLFIFTIFISNSVFSSVPEINVKIAEKVRFLKISSSNDFDFYFLRGQEHKSTQKNLEFDCDFKVSDEQKTVMFASLEAKTENQNLIFNNKSFGKHLKIATSKTHGCDLIQSIKISNYLGSLLAKEMNGSWPLEALKAQAVAARSYAMDKINKTQSSNFDIISGEIHQVSGSQEDVTEKTSKAVFDTQGEVLVNDEKLLVPGFYHAECGGKILEPIDVWSGQIFDYVSKDCPYCHHKSRQKKWTKKISFENLKKFIKKFFGDEIENIEKISMINSESIHLKINGKNYIFLPSEFRKNMLSLKLKSNNFKFEIDENNKKIEIIGAGRGHGVGMCQLGALKMAELGFNYREILKFYYPKLNIKKVY